MEVQISLSTKDKIENLEKGIEYLSSHSKNDPKWEKDQIYGSFKADCFFLEEKILDILKGLIEQYPQLNLFASYSFDIREEDDSAQWWRTVTIKTNHHSDGTTTLDVDSSTNWF